MSNSEIVFPTPDSDENVELIISKVNDKMKSIGVKESIIEYANFMRQVFEDSQHRHKKMIGTLYSDVDKRYSGDDTLVTYDNGKDVQQRVQNNLEKMRTGSERQKKIAEKIIYNISIFENVQSESAKLVPKIEESYDNANKLKGKAFMSSTKKKREERLDKIVAVRIALLRMEMKQPQFLKGATSDIKNTLVKYVKDLQTKKEVKGLNNTYNNEESIFSKIPIPSETRNEIGSYFNKDYKYEGKNAKKESEPSVGPIDENEEAEGKPSVEPIEENEEADGKPSFGSIGGKGISKCKKITSKKKYTTRKSPPYSASKCARGTRKKGNDGKLYVVKSTSKGVNRWLPVVSKKVKQTKKYKKSKKYTQKKR